MSCCSIKKEIKKGFTLIEMLIVIVIVGILASALLPRMASARGKANDVSRKADLQQLATALISYQVDNNSFPTPGAKTQIASSGTIATALIKGGMASIPVGDPTPYTGIDNILSSGYMYYPMKKNGGNGNGFIVMTRAETEGGANYIICSSTPGITVDGSYDIDTIKVCSAVTLSTTAGTCNATGCIADDKSQLRYIYKY